MTTGSSACTSSTLAPAARQPGRSKTQALAEPSACLAMPTREVVMPTTPPARAAPPPPGGGRPPNPPARSPPLLDRREPYAHMPICPYARALEEAPYLRLAFAGRAV